jgi:hypothetical protein
MAGSRTKLWGVRPLVRLVPFLGPGVFCYPAHASGPVGGFTLGKKRFGELIRSSHQGRKDKAIAEVLAMIADTHLELPELAPQVMTKL